MFGKNNKKEEDIKYFIDYKIGDDILSIQDISIRMIYIDTLFHITSGLGLISYCYGSYFTTIFEMVTSIKGINKDQDEYFRIKYSELIRNFFRELEIKKSENSDYYEIFNKIFNLYTVDKSSYSLLTIKDIEGSFYKLSQDIISCANDPHPLSWPTNHFKDIDSDIYEIYNNMRALAEDIATIYLDIPYKLLDYKKEKISNTTDLYNSIQKVLVVLDSLYKGLSLIMIEIMGGMNLALPLGDIPTAQGLKISIDNTNNTIINQTIDDDF